MVAFQCDLCQFYNVRKRYPLPYPSDDLLMLCIRRAILDSFWSRERSTVAKNLSEYRVFMDISDTLGSNDPFPPRGPFPPADADGMEVACNLLIRSLRPGRNATHVQYETVRKGRALYSNYIHASAGGTGQVTLTLGGDRGGSYQTSSPTNSNWFRRFMNGCHRRMGDVWIPDRALPLDEVLAALAICEDDWGAYGNQPEMLLPIALTATLLVTGVGAGLRGEEIPRIDIKGMREHWHEGTTYQRQPHVPLVLVGRFKQVLGEKRYIQPLAVKSKSGIDYKKWIHRTLSVYNHLGIVDGPMFRVMGKQGKMRRATIGDLDLLLHDVVKRVQVHRPDILPASVNVVDETSARRSLRRTFTTVAQNAGVPEEAINANNRWKKHLHSKGVLPSMSMIERYSDAKASVELLVRPSAML